MKAQADARTRMRRKLEALSAEVSKLPDSALGALLRSGVIDEAIVSVRALTMIGRAADTSVGEIVNALARRFRGRK